MTPIKIGIVEDELIIARSIMSLLDELGYSHCGPAISYTEAVQLLKDEQPDLLLLDINLSGKKDGIDLAGYINTEQHIPFIFLTAFSDTETIERAKKVNPNAYIVKPFIKEELYAAIEIAFNNFASQQHQRNKKENIAVQSRDAMFVKDSYQFKKVNFNDILFLESEHNYVTLYLADKKKYTIRSGFGDFLQKLPYEIFLQVHRRFAINLRHVECLEVVDVVVKDKKIPVSKIYRNELMKRLGINQ